MVKMVNSVLYVFYYNKKFLIEKALDKMTFGVM